MEGLQEQTGSVSVWLGHFDSEAEWKAYLEEQYEDDAQPMNAFAAEFGLGFYYDHDMQEANFQPDDKAIADLLSNNSYAASFLPAVVTAAQQAGMEKANVSLLLYDCACQPASFPSEQGNHLQFLGVFSYRKT